MTDKEKARAYDEALERAKYILHTVETAGCAMHKDLLTEIFPELAESEDERIIKTLQEYVKNRNWPLNGPTQDEVLAYLEKQKEQKPLTAKEYHDKFDEMYGQYKPNLVEQKPTESISQLIVQGKGVYKICPHCKERMIRDVSKVYTSMPPQYGYTCPKCGTMEFDTVMYDSPEMKEQKSAECDKETEIQKAFREGQNAGRQEVFDHPGTYGLENIDNVFGFRIGDKVRLVDGDGRPHIIKYFEKIEGLHGPDFYRAVFEDNTASDHIIPGDEYPNGYYTQMEKIDGQKEQKSVEIDEEINRWMGCEAFPEGTNITPLPQAMEIVERTAKHFFEFGEKTVPSPGGYWEGFRHGVRECQDKIRDVKDTVKEQKSIEDVVKDITKNKESAIKFLKSAGIMDDNGELAEMYRSEQESSEWSEEDEKHINIILRVLDRQQCWDGATGKKFNPYQGEIDWLKSPRPRPSWKPSEEQMEALSDAYVEANTFKKGDILESLYNDLKKLM